MLISHTPNVLLMFWLIELASCHHMTIIRMKIIELNELVRNWTRKSGSGCIRKALEKKGNESGESLRDRIGNPSSSSLGTFTKSCTAHHSSLG